MAVGKNKRLSRGGRKGGKRKIQDPFSKKEWYIVRAPGYFKQSAVGNTLATRSVGTKLSQDSLKGRIMEFSLDDLQHDEDQAFKKIKLSIEDVQARQCLTDFAGMDMTRDHLCSLVRKWKTLIEAQCDVKTADGYTLRLFCIGFTQRRPNQIKATCYAKSSTVKLVRQKMIEIMQEESSKVPLKELVKKFIPESIGKSIQKATRRLCSMDPVHIRKVKVLKKPKADQEKLMELYAGADFSGAAPGESTAAKNLLATEVETAW